VIDFFKTLKVLIERYEQYNMEREDDLIIHTDCLDDFYAFAVRVEGASE